MGRPKPAPLQIQFFEETGVSRLLIMLISHSRTPISQHLIPQTKPEYVKYFLLHECSKPPTKHGVFLTALGFASLPWSLLAA